MQKKKLLLLEDDALLRENLEAELREEGCEVFATGDSEAVIEETFGTRFDAYIFDINVIGEDGIALLKSLRESGDATPTLFISAMVDTPTVIEGFKSGADDYLRKPFDFEELLVRLERILPLSDEVEIDDAIRYDPSSQTLHKGDERIVLCPKEAAILEYFLAHPGRIIPNEELIAAVWEEGYIGGSTFRGYVNKLKSYLGKQHIRNVRGQGYIYETV